MNARSEFSRTPRTRLLAALVGLLCTIPALAATPKQVDKEFWLSLDSQSLQVKSAADAVVEKTAPTRSDVRFHSLHKTLPVQMRGKVLTPEGLARAHLGLLDGVSSKRATLDSLKLANVSPLRNGAQIVRFRTEVGGIEVFRRDVSLLLDGDQNLRAISGVWPSVPSQVLGKAVPAYLLDAQQALGRALGVYGFSFQDVSANARPTNTAGAYRSLLVSDTLRGAGGEQVHSARAKQVLFPNNNQLIPAWYVETVVGKQGETDSDYFAHVVDAVTGDILFRNNQTVYESYQYNVWAEDAPSYLPQPGPQGRQTTPYPAASDQGLLPSAVPATLITLENTPFVNAATDPWLPDSASVTTGNNTDAYADLVAPDGFGAGDVRGTAVSAGDPAPPAYDPTLAPNDSQTQIEAAVRQMFYMVNWTHDWYYDAGLDEASGNAQNNNFGRGGVGGDAIKAEGQDSGGTNNANMSTPSDGAQPRMQMYTWSPVGLKSFTRLTPMPAHASGAVGVAGWNSVPFDLSGNVVQAIDADNDGAGADTTTDGCSAFNNAGAINGNIAFIDRGGCGFVAKVQNAFNAGAVGAVIGNLASSNPPGTMGDGGAPPVGGAESLPALLINFVDAEDLRAALSGAVTGRMLRSPGVSPDGTIDNQIIAHELGHYISNRLVYNSSGLTTNHSGGLGEGWGDFHALLMTVKEDDLNQSFGADYAGAYAMASYSTGNYWAGIRAFPYSTDLAINPLTYGDLLTQTEVHDAGEIWTSSLWQCYAGILNSGITFAEAQQRMKEYLIAGYKLTPPAPFFTEARDAILTAIIAQGEIMDFEACAAGFASRGAGIFAVPPSDRNTTTNAGVVEDFSIDGRISLGDIGNVDDSAASCDIDGVLDVGEQGIISLPFNNIGWLSLFDSEVQVSSDFGGLTFPGGTTISVPNTVPYQSETIQIPVSLDSAPGGDVTLTFTASDPDVGTPPSPLMVSLAMNFDYAFAASDDFEGGTFDGSDAGWHTAEELGASSSKKWVKRDVSGSQVAFGADIGSGGVAWLESPAIDVGPATTVQLSHRFRFETGAEADGNYDGGVVEIAVDGGAWTELSLAEYTNTLSNCCGNPLAGRDAFTLDSAGYPGFTGLNIDLGTAYNGSSVQLRFGMAEDGAGDNVGWDIDTVTVVNGLNLPFPTGTAAQALDCTSDTPPVAVADSITVLQGGNVTVLDGGATSVRDNDTDVEDGVPTGDVALVNDVAAGNSLTLNADGTFSYTDGTDANDSFTYTVMDSDGNVSDPATVSIVVNHAPTVDATIGDQTNDEGDVINISLAGVFADSDGNTLSFSASNLPANISVVGDALTGTLNANSADNSPYAVVVTADDGVGGTVQDSFNWTVNDTQTNNAPTVVSPIADQSHVEGQSVSIDLAPHFTDADGDPLTFGADVLPDGVSIVGSVITGTLSLVSAGSYSVTITADDGFTGMVSAPAFTWDVSPSPTISTPANVTIAEMWVGDSAAPTFDIGNTGDAGAPNLTWTISESTDNCVTSGANNVSWFSAAPLGGSTAQGGTTAVTVNIDTAALAHGTNVQGSLCVASSDPATPVSIVPVIITTLRPAHDLFDRAKVVSVDGSGLYTDVVTGALATKNTTIAPIDPVPSCAGSFAGTLWYSFAPVEDGLLALDTVGSSGAYGDTVLSIYTFDAGSFTELDCNDDAVGALSGIQNLRVNAGTTYYVQAAKYGNAEPVAPAVLTLNVDFQAFTGDAVMTLTPSAINAAVPSATTTTRDLLIRNENSTGDRPLDWEIVDQSGGWRPAGVTAGPIRAVTTLSAAAGNAAGGNGQGELQVAAMSLSDTAQAQLPVLNAIDLGLTLSQTVSNVTTTGAVHCAVTGGTPTTENRYLRAFTLADYGIVDAFNVTQVSIGIYGSNAAETLTVKLYLLTGETLTYANMTEIGSTTVSLPSLGVVNSTLDVPLNATVAPDQTLVAEFTAPALGAGVFYFGANALGQSAPAYFVAPTCGLNEPTPLSAIGFPATHVPLTVSGEYTCDTPTDLNWLDADTLSGSVEPDSGQTVNFTLGDAGLADGNYAANLCVLSNDPAQQIKLLPVNLNVGDDLPVIEVDASVSASATVGGTASEMLSIGNTGAAELLWSIAEATGASRPDGSVTETDMDRTSPAVSGNRAGDTDKRKAPVGSALNKAGQVVQDGGFEATDGSFVNPFWNDGSTAYGGVMCDGSCGGPAAHSGSWYSWFGGASGGTTDFAEQDVTIPAGINAVLSYWILKNASANVNFTVSIDGDVLATYTTESFAAWTRVDLDVAGYADGGAHTVRFDSVTTGSGNVFIDDVALNYAEACDLPTDIAWLEVTPTSGAVAAAGLPSEVILDFDADGLAAGTYNANLCVDSNDYVTPRVTVPVTFTVVVNSAPSFSAGGDPAVNEDAGAQTLSGWATAMDDGDGGSQSLAFNVTGNTNASLFSVAPSIDATTGDLTFTAAANANGSADITFELMDDGGTADGGTDTSTPAMFTIVVTAVNDAPGFTPGGDEGVLEDSGAATIAGWATGISAGPSDESGQVLAFNVSNDNNALFSVQPSIDAGTGDLSFTPAAGASGTAEVTVTLSDDGGTALGGVDTSASEIFTITVSGVNDDPVLVGTLEAQVNDEGEAVNLDISAAFDDADGDTLSFDASGLPAGLSISAAGVISGTVDFSAGDDDPSSYTVTIQVDDGNGGSTSAQFSWTVNNALLPNEIFNNGFED